MKKLLVSSSLLATILAIPLPAIADHDDEARSENTFTLAVYGDAPYGCKAPSAAAAPDECPVGSAFVPDSPNGPNPGDPRQILATPAFIEAINRDRKVDLVVHTGDIHSGATYCTLAYDQTIFDLWTQFRDPLVYTPGDNEWTDCQKSKQGGGVKNAAGEYIEPCARALDVLPGGGRDAWRPQETRDIAGAGV
jgi:hypothetical protein